MTPKQKINFAEMRASGERGLVVCCADHKCSHTASISGDEWPGEVRLSDLEPVFVCKACGHRGATLRPNYQEAAKRKTVLN